MVPITELLRSTPLRAQWRLADTCTQRASSLHLQVECIFPLFSFAEHVMIALAVTGRPDPRQRPVAGIAGQRQKRHCSRTGPRPLVCWLHSVGPSKISSCEEHPHAVFLFQKESIQMRRFSFLFLCTAIKRAPLPAGSWLRPTFALHRDLTGRDLLQRRVTDQETGRALSKTASFSTPSDILCHLQRRYSKGLLILNLGGAFLGAFSMRTGPVLVRLVPLIRIN